MTPQPQQQELPTHKCFTLCSTACNLCKDASCRCYHCTHDTRTPRPATSPTPYDHDVIGEFCKTARAEAAVQAREKVLKEIIEHLQSKRGEVMRMATDAYPIGVLDGTVLYLESLRTGGEPR